MNGLHDLLAKLKTIEEASDQNAMRRPMAQQSAERMAAQKQQQPQPQDQGGAGAADESMEGASESHHGHHKQHHKPDMDDEDDYYDQGGEEGQNKQRYEPLPHPGDHVNHFDEIAMGECPSDGNVQLSMADLLKLVTQLQKGQDPHAAVDQPLMGDEVGEEFGNAMPGAEGPEVAPVAAVTPTGDDMHSKGAEAEKVNGGGNPLQAQLAELYSQIKEREAQLAELSKGTLASYAKKASAGASTAAFKAGMARNDSEFSKQNAKASKREAGLDKAIDKMSLKEANQMARQLRK